jgi:hypothetical protein
MLVLTETAVFVARRYDRSKPVTIDITFSGQRP